MSPLQPQSTTKIYKQEGKTGIFQSMLWALAVSRAKESRIPVSWGEYFVYFKNYYLGVYWDEEGFERVSREVFNRSRGGLSQSWLNDWHVIDTSLTNAARELSLANLDTASDKELHNEYEKLYALDQQMWSTSIFIDTFDPGFDQKFIEEIAQEHSLTDEEVQILVSPTAPSFITEWNNAALAFEQNNKTFDELKHHFFWIATDYSSFSECTKEFVHEESSKKLADEFMNPRDMQNEILKRHALSENPLLLFQQLTTMRDVRKRLNYTGCYGLLRILREIMRRQSINPDCVSALIPEQVSLLFSGALTQSQLENQLTESVLYHVSNDGEEHLLFGDEASTTHELLESVCASVETEIRGVSASRGVVRGHVRIVPHITNHNAHLMKEGEVLVTSMTRPEFLSLMRKSCAIVTNEGGITSHAAIVSRELGIPCVIGTKIATKVLRDGDFVEVDAEAGLVRILEKASTVVQ